MSYGSPSNRWVELNSNLIFETTMDLANPMDGFQVVLFEERTSLRSRSEIGYIKKIMVTPRGPRLEFELFRPCFYGTLKTGIP